MPSPVRSLTVVQNWDCESCSRCCREYEVLVTPAERDRILSQDWTDLPCARNGLIVNRGRWGARRQVLGQTREGACVFLSPEGRCRIHERYGPEAKPLACRLYPFILVRAGQQWRVGLRFACPAAAASHGRPLTAHSALIEDCACEVERAIGAERYHPEPRTYAGQTLSWDAVHAIVQRCAALLTDRQFPLERRVRHVLAFARLARPLRYEIPPRRLGELLELLAAGAVGETAERQVVPPSWVGRVLFRQFLALYARQDRGTDRGQAQRSRLGLLKAGWRFARGRGTVPRVHAALPDLSFEEVEKRSSPSSTQYEECVERYFLVKLESFQFFGPPNFGLPLWEGLESLLLTFPILGWLSRALADDQSMPFRAVAMVDNNFGYNPLLAGMRQRVSLRILSQRREIDHLAAHYGR